jgi:hypothetical protein
MQRYRWKTWANKQSERQNNKYDVAHKKDDHAMDDLRYFFTVMPDLTPLKSVATPVAALPNLGPDGINPGPRTNPYLEQNPVAQSDWSVSYQDDYMGGEW